MLKVRVFLFLILVSICGVRAEEDVASLEKRAAGGDAEAQLALGSIYDEGRGVPKDQLKAVEWFLKSAMQGNAQAQFFIGALYANGQGLPKDDRKAIEWYEKSAAQGVVDAQFNLGVMYAGGRGVPKDPAKAAEWYEKAALQGLTRAQFNLGLMNLAGQGVPKDVLRGYVWFAVAAADGDPAAIKNRDFIEKQFEAKRLAEIKADKIAGSKAAEKPDMKAEGQKLARELAAKIKR